MTQKVEQTAGSNTGFERGLRPIGDAVEQSCRRRFDRRAASPCQHRPSIDCCDITVWEIQASRPRGHYPILVGMAEQGAVKTMTARAPRRLRPKRVRPRSSLAQQ